MDTLLIIDDEKGLLEVLNVVFRKEGYEVKTATSGAEGLDILNSKSVDLVITDIRMPHISGMEVLRYVKENQPEIPVIVITAYGSIAQAVEALKAGALDYIVKPFDVEELKILVARGLERKHLEQENILLKKDLKEKYKFENMIGKSRLMQEIYLLIDKVAGTDSTVLVTGESGTGKEMAARAIHSLSRRKDKPFVTINCAALPENLLESELFGHTKGSFTGAISDKKGMFEVAHKGTLFLDEIGEMSPWTQVKLLRALQERKIRRVGGTEEIPVDVRVIAATNQDLKKRIEEGKFREDLYYRLNVISFEMPPLRSRVEDIPLLTQHFLQKYCQQMGKKMKRLAPEVVGIFEQYPWPGNIRELENVIERIVAIEDRETITPACLPPEMLGMVKREEQMVELGPGFDLNRHLDDLAKKYIIKALEKSGGRMKKAAPLLGVSYRTLRYLIDKYDLKTKIREGEEENNQLNAGESER
ncbi:MAG: Response regulator of zinc sigma-54-dependent two-component system [Candidatus Saccharicenans subterraneus]|uniref:Response regulator of zinc sigma-54-dependent two-component system n=1 Tax=Candidatus Saccharicenans subterraneus TaxID=2508984 RepID=A0A3E2BNC5_9BACT|nr:MAG: Response regulator of zinc sigma-54-dependent two-component system [Candidatus Saccharicenans subterraneum]